MTIYGYARVSTDGQSLDAQIHELRAVGCEVVYAEKKSGSTLKQRTELAELRGKIARDDVLVVVRIDRLARSTVELLTIAKELRERGAHLKSLREKEWCDTTTPIGWLMLTVLAGVAEFERARILERTAEGRARAKEAGEVRFGRPPALLPYQEEFVRKKRAEGVSLRKIANELQVGHSTVARVKCDPPTAE